MDDRKEREQLKLRMFFDPDRWERLLNQAHEKELNRAFGYMNWGIKRKLQDKD